ncbi:alpha/beta hydrolase [Streptomyces sp. NPDC005573]|uniref:alpha/beta hydrolase n=1 Tax=Streptomyces sp. NPDC005573 TaxID=3156890 RepID=UPI0033BD7977
MSLDPPPFDPELAACLESNKDVITPGLAPDEIAPAREETNADLAGLLDLLDLTTNGAFAFEDRAVPGPEGAPEVSLLVCRPKSAGAGASLPVIYYVHGGGMVLGTNRAGVDGALNWALELGAVVVSVEYRLAPEHPYPAQIDDVYAGFRWTAAHAGEIGGDPDRIVVAGSSAGAGLGAALALLLRDRQGPPAIGQLLMSPMLDDHNDTVSGRQMTGIGVWDRTANETAWTAVLGDRRGGPDVPPYASPARADDLSGLPPALLDVGSAETFRDEVVTYASRIWQAGGDAELHVWPGGFHGFDTFAPHTALARAARAAQLTWLTRLLDR